MNAAKAAANQAFSIIFKNFIRVFFKENLSD